MLEQADVAVYTMYLGYSLEEGFKKAVLGYQKNFATMWSDKPGFSPNPFPYAFVVDLRTMKVVEPELQPGGQVVTAYDAATTCSKLPDDI